MGSEQKIFQADMYAAVLCYRQVMSSCMSFWQTFLKILQIKILLYLR